MSIANSSSVSPVFIENEPDRESSVAVTQSWMTDISFARDGAEQRSRRQSKPKYGVEYQINAHTGQPWALRRASVIRELGAPVVVPIWTHWLNFISEASDVVTLNAASLDRKPFKTGSYAYFVESGLSSCFRLIESVSVNQITLETGNAAWPDIAVPSYTAACRVYPCVLGMRADNTYRTQLRTVDETHEVIAVEEL